MARTGETNEVDVLSSEVIGTIRSEDKEAEKKLELEKVPHFVKLVWKGSLYEWWVRGSYQEKSNTHLTTRISKTTK